MRNILGVILAFTALLSVWGCAGTQTKDVPEGEKLSVAGGESREYEVKVIEKFEYFTVSEGIKVFPFESEVGEKMPYRLLKQIPGDIERRIEKEGLLYEGIQRVGIRGKIIEVSDGQEGKVVAVRVEFFDPHNWHPLGTVEIRGRAKGPGSLDRAIAAIPVAVTDLLMEKAAESPAPIK